MGIKPAHVLGSIPSFHRCPSPRRAELAAMTVPAEHQIAAFREQIHHIWLVPERDGRIRGLKSGKRLFDVVAIGIERINPDPLDSVVEAPLVLEKFDA